MNEGFVHLYWGEGKGKTTAAAGLAVRALGQGRRVAFLQFLKDGTSGEMEMLRRLGCAVFAGKTGTGFVSRMPRPDRERIRDRQNALLEEALAGDWDLLVLDEACAAWRMDQVDRALLKRAVLDRPAGREVVLTGREPPAWMLEAADYSTEMRCEKHPYARGVGARRGIEY